MDLIVTAIVGALAKLSETAVKDAYNGLKAIITRKFGAGTEVTAAIEKLEQKPSPARTGVLKEELAAAGVDRDEEVKAAAEALLQKLNAAPGAQVSVQQTVSGERNVFSGTGNVHATYGSSKK